MNNSLEDADSRSVDLRPYVRQGDTIMWAQAQGQPLSLIKALLKQRHDIGQMQVFLGIGFALEDVVTAEHADVIRFYSYCAAGSNRVLMHAGALDILPIHYSEIASRIRNKSLPVDVVMLQVPPPDEHGRFSLGMCRDYMVAALSAARTVIAEVDDSLPFTLGGPYLREEQFDLLLPTTCRQALPAPAVATPAEQAIAGHIADLIPHGATLQIGIGNLPDSVLAALKDHRDLGFHSGTLGDGLVLLAASGALTNAKKPFRQGISVGGMLQGGEPLRRFAHHNRLLELQPIEYTHDAQTLAAHNRFVSINSAIEVDLTGQVNSEVAGGRYVGAVGGALDFVRGALQSDGGIPIIAMPSTSRQRSRVVHRLSGPATIPRSDACVIVTEHGIADLRGLTLQQRIEQMIAIADPTHRESLRKDSRRL